MRVKIGKYPSRLTCRWYSNHMDEKYGYAGWPRKRDRTRYDRFVEKADDAVQLMYNVLNRAYFDRREQKVKVKIDPWDTWGMDTTLGHIALPMLKQLRATKHGAPVVDVEDVPDHLRPTSEELEEYNKDGTTDDKFFERWDWVLGEMIFAFESLQEDWEEQFRSGEIDMVSVPLNWSGEEVDELDADMYRMDDGPNHTYTVDYEGMREYQERISNGFRLFGKYYLCLWD